MTERMRKLEYMYGELCNHSLVTMLAPSKRRINEHDMIRVNLDVPPPWYRKMAGLHASKRGVRRGKFDTIIRRAHTLRALERLIANKPRGGIYEERILSVLPGIKI